MQDGRLSVRSQGGWGGSPVRLRFRKMTKPTTVYEIMRLRSLVPLATFFVGLSLSLARNPEPTTAATWKIKAGDNRTHIAKSRYGSEAYAGFLKQYTQVEPRKLHVGKALPTPDFAEAMTACGATKAAPKVVAQLCTAYENFRATEKLIWDQRRGDVPAKIYRPLHEKTLDALTEVQGNFESLQLALGTSALPEAVSRSISERLRRVESRLLTLVAYEGIGGLSTTPIHRDIDFALRTLMKHAADQSESRST